MFRDFGGLGGKTGDWLILLPILTFNSFKCTLFWKFLLLRTAHGWRPMRRVAFDFNFASTVFPCVFRVFQKKCGWTKLATNWHCRRLQLRVYFLSLSFFRVFGKNWMTDTGDRQRLVSLCFGPSCSVVSRPMMTFHAGSRCCCNDYWPTSLLSPSTGRETDQLCAE